MEKIIIKTYQPDVSESNIFRLQPDAAEIVRQHQRASGHSASHIISEIIRQTKDDVCFVREEAE